MNEPSTKHKLFQLLLNSINESIAAAQQAMEAAEASRNNETKSSVGDKYETGRAMMQLEFDRHKAQWLKAKNLKIKLNQINIEKKINKVDLGSLVITNLGNYFLSVGLGKLELDGIKYFAISPEAPVGKVLLGKQVNESIPFNGQQILVEKIV